MSTKRDQAFGFSAGTPTPFLATTDALTVVAGDLISVTVGWINGATATATVVDNLGGNVLQAAYPKRTHSNNDMCEQTFWGVAQTSGTINPRVDFAGGTPNYANIKAYSASGSGGWALGNVASDQNTVGTSATTPAASFTGITGAFVVQAVQFYGVRVITPGANFGSPNEFGSPSTELAAVYSTTQSGTGSIAGLVTWSQDIAWMSSIAIFIEVVGDTTAPTLTSPTATGGTLTCSGSVSTNEPNGTLYTVVCASATPPTALQVEAGQDSTGAAALRFVTQAVTAAGTQNIASGAVTAGTRYMYFMHKDSAGNRSTVASAASFVVSAGADTTPPDQAGSITIGTVTDVAIQFSWPAGTDDVAVTGYDVSKDGGTTYTTLGNVLTHTFTGLTASTTYQLRVRPRDAAGNVVATPLAASATTSAVPAPGITGISNATPLNGGSVTITGTNFGAAGPVTLGGVAQTVTARSGTSITFTVVRGVNKYGVPLGITVADTATGLTSTSFAGVTSLSPTAGWAYVDIATPLADTTKRLTSVADLASGDQIHYDTGSGSVIALSDATFSTAGAVNFAFEVWTPVYGWGTQATQTVT